MGRPRGRLSRRPNHHLTKVGGEWWVRIVRKGFPEIRKPTGSADAEIARAVRDAVLEEAAKVEKEVRQRDALGLPEVPTIKALIELYLEHDSKAYDREKGGEQLGCKRSSADDRVYRDRLFRFLEPTTAADELDAELLGDVAGKMADAGLASYSRRHVFRFLSRVYSWALVNKRKSGITSSPFSEIDKRSPLWRKLFKAEVLAVAPPLSAEEARQMWAELPDYAARLCQFVAHTGLRYPSEPLDMVWGRIDFEKRTLTLDPRYTKGGKSRTVPLNDVAIGILREVRPANPGPADPVWIGRGGKPIEDIRTVWEKAVKKVCKAPEQGFRYPTPYSLRDTAATALDKVAPRAVVMEILGHSRRSVRDVYVHVNLEDCLAAVQKAMPLIDGSNVVQMRPRAPKMEVKMEVTAG